MNNKSYLLLIFLIIVLAFVLGFRSGQKVEKTNKKVDYLLSLPSPTTPISFTPNEAEGEVGPTPLTYKEYKSKKWGLKFTFPSNLEVKESTNASEILFEVY
ncbi:MAG: hypothetical protein V1803_02460 [Candidatus Roizmanbacteria bacterium]